MLRSKWSKVEQIKPKSDDDNTKSATKVKVKRCFVFLIASPRASTWATNSGFDSNVNLTVKDKTENAEDTAISKLNQHTNGY
jgi:hypothetical protein